MLSAALPLNLRYAPARSWAWVVKPQPSCCLVQNRPILEKPRYLHIISDPIWKVHLEGACRACDILFSLNPWISGVRGSSLEFRMFQNKLSFLPCHWRRKVWHYKGASFPCDRRGGAGGILGLRSPKGFRPVFGPNLGGVWYLLPLFLDPWLSGGTW